MSGEATTLAEVLVEQAFLAVPAAPRERLLMLRALIFDTAARTPGVGAIDETLKWGEPAYVTAQSGSGSTVRLGLSARLEIEGIHINIVSGQCQMLDLDLFRFLGVEPELVEPLQPSVDPAEIR